MPSSATAPWAAPGRFPGGRPGKRSSLLGVYKNFSISGVTRDGSGTPLAACAVKLFRTGDGSFVAQTTSDGSGNYSFTLGDNAGNFYIVAYLPGSPDVAGTTVNTLVAA